MKSYRFVLSAMMFLEFFIWGAWLPPSFDYFGDDALKFTELQQFLLTIAFPVSAIIAMFFANEFVDRFFAAEKFLAFSHLVGGLAMLGFGLLSWQAFSGTEPMIPNYWLFFACMAIHCFFYVPTISVTNTIAFANMADPQKEFGPVRLWGTIGWIAASWPFIFILVDWAKVPGMNEIGIIGWLGEALGKSLKGTSLNQGKSWAFLTARIVSLLLAGFSLALPHTPPKGKRTAGDTDSATSESADIFSLLTKPFILVLFVATWIDATVHDGYFIFAFSYLIKVGVPANWVQPAMSVGQIAEIGTMAFLGFVLKNLGWRYTMILGILGHTARFAVFALVPNPYAAVAINLMHGICYAFFFATLYILVDEVFPKNARTRAQGLFNFLILGLGPITARYLWPFLKGLYTTKTETGSDVNYNQLLLIPAGLAMFAAILLLLFFHPPKPQRAELDDKLT